MEDIEWDVKKVRKTKSVKEQEGVSFTRDRRGKGKFYVACKDKSDGGTWT